MCTFRINQALSIKNDLYDFNDEFAQPGNRWEDASYYTMVGVHVPEVFLIRAEANARLGNKPAAIDDLNTLRSHRIEESAYSPYDPDNFTQQETIELVKDERRRELFFMGLRWFDLKRYNAIENAGISIERYFSGETLAPGDPGWVMPIAQLYFDQNPEMEWTD